MAKQRNASTNESKFALLKKERAELDALFRSIGDGAIVTDSHGSISRINDIALELLGYRRSQVLGKWYPDVVVAEDELGTPVENIDRPNTEVFLTGRPVHRRLVYHKKDGTKLPVAATVSPVLLAGNPIGAIEVFRDITAEVKLEKTKDEFISVASHELRTPATIVKQYLGMVLGGYFGALTRDQRRMIQNAYDSNERQLDIINNMLQVAHAEADKIQVESKRVSVTKLIRRVIDEQDEKYKDRDHTVMLTSKEADCMFYTDPVHLNMIIGNVLSNAHKYTPEHKKITITLRKENQKLRITIKDEGVGIEQNDMPKLFQKFSRIDNALTISSGGSGLGLFWVKKLVELHSGKIDVRSRPGIGTTFEIYLSPAA